MRVVVLWVVAEVPADGCVRLVTTAMSTSRWNWISFSPRTWQCYRFEGFMKEFGKVYHTVEEYEHRFGVFKDNLLKALKHQALDPTASHGVSQFSDLTKEEFGHQYLGLKAPSVLKTKPSAPILPTDDLPPSFDWREWVLVSG
jgi:hypothetical protein